MPSTHGASIGEAQRIPELDGIRAIAIGMVLLLHVFFGYSNPAGALDFLPRPIFQLLGHGWLGVDLFFVLSGFLITGILLDTREQPHYFRNFYIRRFLRIMPLYFTMLIVWSFFYQGYSQYFWLSSIFGGNLASLFHVRVPHGPGVLWSLAIEEHFYLLWPLVVLLLNRRVLLLLCLAIFMGSPLLRGIYAAQGMKPEMIYDLSWFRFDGLALGAMLSLWARSEYRDRKSGNKVAIALLSLLVILCLVGAHFGLFGTKTVAAVALRYTQAYLVFGALFVLTLTNRNTRWTSLLRNKFLQLIGALSYCLYLVHLSVGDGYVYLMNHQSLIRVGPTATVLLRGGVVLSISFGIALLSRKYLEGPFMSLKPESQLSSEVSNPEAVAELRLQSPPRQPEYETLGESAPSKVDISVVLATYNRAASLSTTLNSLSSVHQSPSFTWELLVIDNNSTDSTRNVIEKFAISAKFSVRYVFEKRQGRSAALNAGIAQAKGDIVVFTDDDVLFDPDWIVNLKQCFDKFNCAAVAGSVVALWTHSKPEWLEMEGQFAVVHFVLGDEPKEIHEPPLGANSAFRKEVFERHGLFRLDLGVRGSEHTITCDDTEFGGRLIRAGEKIMYCPTAIVYHPVDPNRTTKKYFLSWYYYNGVSLTRTAGLPSEGVFYFGVPRWLYRELLENFLRWMLSLRPNIRFHWKLRTYRSIGNIVESRRLSRQKALGQPEIELI